LFVPTRDVRGRRNPAEIPFHIGGRMGWRRVNQLVERCPDLAERGAIPLAFDAPTETDTAGTNSFGLCRAMPSSDAAVKLIPMTSHGR
jgi:hypothetical protein